MKLRLGLFLAAFFLTESVFVFSADKKNSYGWVGITNSTGHELSIRASGFIRILPAGQSSDFFVVNRSFETSMPMSDEWAKCKVPAGWSYVQLTTVEKLAISNGQSSKEQ